MNEIKKIHLGRHPFTIAIDAYKTLQLYLHAIEQEVGNNHDVLKEIELRMAELLAERNITGEKVILPEDVAFLKEQLGTPADFKEDNDNDSEDGSSHAETDETSVKRLYRDTDRAAIAGVAAGLGAYFGVDPIIPRLLFVVFTFVGGSGILLYLLLWILVPPAKTSSERLQMRGQAVTIDAIKKTIDQADVVGAASKASKTINSGAVAIMQVLRVLVGVGLLISAMGTIFASLVGAAVFAHGFTLAGVSMGPSGTMQVGFALAILGAMLLFATICFVAGISMIRKRAVIAAWIITLLVSLFVAVLGAAIALGVWVVPQIHARINGLHQTAIYTMPAFTKLDLSGTQAIYTFVPDSKYFVELHYDGPANVKIPLSKKVENNTLTLDSSQYAREGVPCNGLCLFTHNSVQVIIHAPTLEAVQAHDLVSFDMNSPFDTPSLTIAASRSANVFFSDIQADSVKVDAATDPTLSVTLTGVHGNADFTDGSSIANVIHLNYQKNVVVQLGSRQCTYDAMVFLDTMPATLTLNDQPIASAMALHSLQDPQKYSAYNCVVSTVIAV